MRYAVSALALASTLVAGAQVSLAYPDNTPVVGSSFPVHAGAWVAPGPGGAWQTYDYSNLVDTATNTYQWLAPSTSPNAGLFPNANLMLVSNGPDTLYFQSSANGMERVGESQLVSVLGTPYQVTAAYTDGILELKLPLAYGDAWTDADAATYTVAGNDAVRSGMITGSGSAHGTLLIPGAVDPIPVLRVTTHLDETNVLGFISISHIRDVVAYYPLYGKFPVLRTVSDSITSSGITQVSRYSEWLDASALGIAALEADAFGMQVRPNPVNTEAEIAFDGGVSGILALDVVDARGAVVLHRSVMANGGRQVERFNVGGWQAGVYHVRLTAANGTRSMRPLVVAH